MSGRLFQAAVVITAVLTAWTLVMAASEFPSRWGGYLMVMVWLAAAWLALALVRSRNAIVLCALVFTLGLGAAGLPILLLAFSAD